MDKIREYVDTMFAALPRTERVLEAKQSILESMAEKYAALLDEGKSANEALGTVISRFGSIDEIKEELGLGAQSLAGGPERDADHALRQEYDRFQKVTAVLTAAAVGLYILAPMLYVMVDDRRGTESSMLVFFTLIAAATVMLVYCNLRKGDFQRRLGLDERDRPLGTRAADPYPTSRADPQTEDNLLVGSIYMLATIVFLAIGFLFGMWHPGWLIFLVATALVMLLRGFRQIR